MTLLEIVTTYAQVSHGVKSLLRICTPTELTLISKVPNPVCILTYSLIVCMYE